MNKSPKVHIAGIGGEGWSWIAKMLIEKGWFVEGCDAADNDRVEFLKKIGLQGFYLGNSSSHINKSIDYFLYSDAILYNETGRSELDEAKKQEIKSFGRNQFFPLLLSDRKVIAIAGTHGKTTTSSMTAYLLDSLGDNCGFGVGGTVLNFETNGRNGDSETFVIEADEFQDAFLGLNQYISVLTSMEYDHPDYFKTYDKYKESFKKYIKNTQKDGIIIVFGDAPDIRTILKGIQRKYYTYGENRDNDLRIEDIKIKEFCTYWKLRFNGLSCECKINFPGKQYAYNCSAALLVSALLGYDLKKACSLTQGFKGAGRRFQKHKVNGITVVNDYGHHPTELRVTLEGALSTGKRVLVLYEPHQYKRCYELKDQFKGVFKGADVLIQAPIYASREKPPYPITNEEFFEYTSKNVTEKPLLRSVDDLINTAVTKVSKDDIIIIFAVGHGADITNSILLKLKEKYE